MYLYPSYYMANFEGDFESGALTNGWSVSGTSSSAWSIESANNGLVHSSMNLCDIGGTAGNPSFHSLNCTYNHPSNINPVELTVTIDNWASEFSMDVILPNGTVDSYNSSDVSNYYNSILTSYTDTGNYTIYLNDTYGDGGTSVSADYSYISQVNPFLDNFYYGMLFL